MTRDDQQVHRSADETPPPHVITAAEAALLGEPEHDRVLMLARIDRYWPDLVRGLRQVYGSRADVVAAEAVQIAVGRYLERESELRLLDLQRLVDPDWFQQPGMLGYACYTERFGGTLKGVAEHVDYLADLGVTYLHLMPLLMPRPTPNDGGYAVMDYRRVRSDLGTVEDLLDLTTGLRANGISLTLDLVINHVAAEHEWAVRARKGEQRYRDYFHLYPDREAPDAFEATLPEVFPDTAPGNFTWDDDLDAWVWTTFNTWQWDLNWHNPDVFAEFADLVLYLANLGVECLRLDAIAFLFKRLGTDSQNQPEVHSLTQALHAVTRIGAPAMIFKAEAIVGPQQLAPYLGVGEHAAKVSDLAYHNGLMVQTWSALAAGDARLAATALQRFPAKPPSTAWATYLRGHDDIGWAVDDIDTRAIGWNGAAHRAFLSDWYCGEFAGSDARGLVFQHNPETGDRRISGTAASLAGVENALESGDADYLELAVRRLLLGHAIVLGFGGLPVLYMGDELGMVNDYAFARIPEHAMDNRWVHRPFMPWDVAARRHEPGTLAHRVWSGLTQLIGARAGLIAMHASVESRVMPPVNAAVLAWERRHPRQWMVGLHNVSEHEQWWPREQIALHGALVDRISGDAPDGDPTGVVLAPYQALWLVGEGA